MLATSMNIATFLLTVELFSCRYVMWPMRAVASVGSPTEGAAAAREPMSLPERRFCGCQRLGDLHARAALVSCRGDEVLDEVVGGASPLGGVQQRFCGPELVDDTDERSRPHRWPDGEDSHADHSSLGLGNDDRCGGNEEKVAQEVGVAASGVWIGVGARKDANGGVEIGQAGAADVNLQGRPQVRFAASAARTARRRIPRLADEPLAVFGDTHFIGGNVPCIARRKQPPL